MSDTPARDPGRVIPTVLQTQYPEFDPCHIVMISFLVFFVGLKEVPKVFTGKLIHIPTTGIIT